MCEVFPSCTSAIDINRLAAVIVSYHPDAMFGKRVDSVLLQVGTVIIVDNSETYQDALDSIESLPRVQVIRNHQNWGIAKALNQGVERARVLKCRWILTLDQDTSPHHDLVSELASAYSRLPRVGILGANSVEGNLAPVPSESLAISEQYSVITSGSLFSLALYDEIGPFRDELFIDAVDQEFCLRARKKKFGVFMVLKPLMSHKLGNSSTFFLCGLPLRYTNHSPARRYYCARNRLYLLCSYGFSEPWWAIDQARRLMQDFLFVVMFEESKLEKTTAMVLGCYDVLLGRFGRSQYHLAD